MKISTMRFARLVLIHVSIFIVSSESAEISRKKRLEDFRPRIAGINSGSRNRFYNHWDGYRTFIDSRDYDSWMKSEEVETNSRTECANFEEGEEKRVLAAAIGGVPVKTAAKNPWMVAIGEIRDNSTEWYCGGILLSEKIIITAAHCLTRRSANVVRVGELDLESNSDEAEPQDSAIEETISHPEYEDFLYYHDIAIVKMKTSVRFTKFVKPICLPEDKWELFENKQAVVSGWGSTEYGGDISPILQEVRVSVLSNSECNKKYDATSARANSRTLPRGIISSQLCAGDRNGGKDSCQGDSGGPLIVREGKKAVVIGLVSSGLGCGAKNYPGIYTRVSHYVDWIQTFLR